MLRFVLLVIFLMALPALVYAAIARLRTGEGLDEIMPKLPIVTLAAAGAVLTAAVLLVYLQINRNAPGGRYVPPVLKNGEIEPGHVER
jgi:hypothetical protein